MAVSASRAAGPVRAAVESAHKEMWKRFIDPRHFTLYDYAGLDGRVVLPTAEDCEQSIPNALGWWTPIENGAFFGGLYLDALCNRHRLEPSAGNAGEARRIAGGLLALAPAKAVPGFIARGISAGGGYYTAGSDDQSLPWVYGLWRYVNSRIPERDERRRILAVMRRVVGAIEGYGWKMPCNREGFGTRGTWIEPNFIHAARLLFVIHAMWQLTGETRWRELYLERLREPLEGGVTRLELCSRGAEYGAVDSKRGYPVNPEFWHSASAQSALRGLWEMETDHSRQAAYRQGLDANARAAAPHIARYRRFSAADTSAFVPDWRFLKEMWTPQRNIAEAVALASRQVREWHRRSPRRVYEAEHMREPLFAAWIVTLAGNREISGAARADMHSALLHYRWPSLYTSLFFAGEGAYYQDEVDSASPPDGRTAPVHTPSRTAR